MLMSFDLMALSETAGDHEYRFDVESATQKDLKAALEFDASYSEVYGRTIFTNLDEITAALKARKPER